LIYRLRTVALPLIEKNSRKKRRVSSQIQHYYVKSTNKDKEPITKQKRGRYFILLRRERNLLKILQWTALPPDFSYRNRMIIRRLYYCTFHFLFLHLRLSRDQQILWELEQTYFSWLNRASISMGTNKRVYRPFWWPFSLDHNQL
jgi:hypothetical protein